MSEKKSAKTNPPTTAIANGCNNSAPAPIASASGSIPKIAASEIIRTGRKRRLPITATDWRKTQRSISVCPV